MRERKNTSKKVLGKSLHQLVSDNATGHNEKDQKTGAHSEKKTRGKGVMAFFPKKLSMET